MIDVAPLRFGVTLSEKARIQKIRFNGTLNQMMQGTASVLSICKRSDQPKLETLH